MWGKVAKKARKATQSAMKALRLRKKNPLSAALRPKKRAKAAWKFAKAHPRTSAGVIGGAGAAGAVTYGVNRLKKGPKPGSRKY